MGEVSVKGVANVGDIVTIHKDKAPRQRWALGKITSLIIGQDGVARGAELITVNSSGKVISIKRPLKKLYLLEVQAEEEDTHKDETVQIKNVKDEDVLQFSKGH